MNLPFPKSDRREYPRKKLRVPLTFNPLNTPDFHQGWIKDISRGGIRVETEVQSPPLARGEQVRFLTGDHSLDGKGRVIWTRDTEGEVGIEFAQFSPLISLLVNLILANPDILAVQDSERSKHLR